jgi:hypothetical protein
LKGDCRGENGGEEGSALDRMPALTTSYQVLSYPESEHHRRLLLPPKSTQRTQPDRGHDDTSTKPPVAHPDIVKLRGPEVTSVRREVLGAGAHHLPFDSSRPKDQGRSLVVVLHYYHQGTQVQPRIMTHTQEENLCPWGY